MKLSEKHINFQNKCREIIGKKIQQIEYAEINYNPENPTPFFRTNFSKIHSVDYSIFFITEKNRIEFFWDSEFTQYAVGIKINEETIFSNTIRWNLSDDEFWKKIIGQRIENIRIGWENEFGNPYPQFVTLIFENNAEIYISAAEFINENDKTAFGFKDNLLVSNDKKTAIETKMIMGLTTTDNIVFAKGGAEYLIELPVAFSRACFSTPHIFSNLVSWKKHSLRLVEIELPVQFSPPFANTFSVVCNLSKKCNNNGK